MFCNKTMQTQPNQLHFVLFPYMAQGHMTPMIDIARLLAEHGVMITVVTTPVNADRFKLILDRAMESGLPIQLLIYQLQCSKAGLPDGCENLDMLPSMSLGKNFHDAVGMSLDPVEKLFESLVPKPNCIISDILLPYTSHIAKRFGVPRISFNGSCCFFNLCLHNLIIFKVLEKIESEDEHFVVPGLPDHIEITKAYLPSYNIANLDELGKQVAEAEQGSYGLIMNTFEELEPEYVKEYKKARGNRVWCVGPVSMCNRDYLDRVQRGNKASIEEDECKKWLDSWKTSSVLYICLGSLCNLIPSQLIELALGLEESNKPFIWAIRVGDNAKPFENWVLESGYEERVKGRGLLILGWVPQLQILSHPAIGGFLTHCGWNSTLEAICTGVPMITLPLFADQFLNETLVVQVLRIGLRIGVEVPSVVEKDNVKKAIDKLMGEGEEKEGIRKRASELGEISKRAFQEGGSSHTSITLLIEEIRQQAYHQEHEF